MLWAVLGLAWALAIAAQSAQSAQSAQPEDLVRMVPLTNFRTAVVTARVEGTTGRGAPPYNVVLRRAIDAVGKLDEGGHENGDAVPWESEENLFAKMGKLAHYPQLLELHKALGKLEDAIVAGTHQLMRAVFDDNNGVPIKPAADGSENGDGTHFEVGVLHAWANINQPSDFEPVHSHGNSVVSGVYFVDAGDVDCGVGATNVPHSDYGSGCLVFHDPKPQAGVGMARGLFSTPLIVKPQAGLLVLFPSWLSHHVEAHNSTRERVSISFNMYVMRKWDGSDRAQPLTGMGPTSVTLRRRDEDGVILSAREAAAVLLDFRLNWLWPTTVALSVWYDMSRAKDLLQQTRGLLEGPSQRNVFEDTTLAGQHFKTFVECSVYKFVCQTLLNNDAASLHIVPPPDTHVRVPLTTCNHTCDVLRKRLGWRIERMVGVGGTEEPQQLRRYFPEREGHISGLYFASGGFEGGVDVFEPRAAAMMFIVGRSVTTSRLFARPNSGTLALIPAYLRTRVAPFHAARRAVAVTVWLAPTDPEPLHAHPQAPVSTPPGPSPLTLLRHAVGEGIQQLIARLGVERAVLAVGCVGVLAWRVLRRGPAKKTTKQA